MGWKQSDLAARMRIGRATVASWENNINRPNFATLRLLAELTDYPIEFFLDEGPDGPTTGRYPMIPWSNLLLDTAA